jgi:Mg2+/Co2+ transporter CorC
VNSITDLDLPVELNTMSGYIVNIIGAVPQAGRVISIEPNVTVSILKSNDRQVELLQLTSEE